MLKIFLKNILEKCSALKIIAANLSNTIAIFHICRGIVDMVTIDSG